MNNIQLHATIPSDGGPFPAIELLLELSSIRGFYVEAIEQLGLEFGTADFAGNESEMYSTAAELAHRFQTERGFARLTREKSFEELDHESELFVIDSKLGSDTIFSSLRV